MWTTGNIVHSIFTKDLKISSIIPCKKEKLREKKFVFTRKKLLSLDYIAEHQADEKYTIVGAASILPKRHPMRNTAATEKSLAILVAVAREILKHAVLYGNIATIHYRLSAQAGIRIKRW